MSKSFRLQTKLLTVVIVLILGMMIITTALISLKEEKSLKGAMFKRMGLDLSYLVRLIGHDMQNANWRFLQITLDLSMKNNSDMIYYFIHDAKGTILVAEREELVGKKDPLIVAGVELSSLDTGNMADYEGFFIDWEIPGTMLGRPYYKDAFAVREMTLRKDAVFHDGTRGRVGESVFDATMKITYGGELLGYLRVGYSKKSFYHRIQEVRLEIFLIGISILLPVLACMLFIVRKHTAPLSQLTREFAKLKCHGTSMSISGILQEIKPDKIPGTTTEIEELKESFTELKALLLENWYQLEEHRNHLKKNVKERTLELSHANLKLRREIQERKMIEESLQVQNRYMKALHKTTLDVISHLELKKLLETVLLRAGRLIGSENGFIYNYNPEKDTLEFRVGLGAYADETIPPIKPGQGLVGKVWKNEKPMCVENYACWEGRIDHPIFDDLQAMVAVPIKSANSTSGVIGLGFFCGEHCIGDEELHILSRFAELTSIALNNARLHTKLHRELEERGRVEEEKAKLFQHLLQVQKLDSIGTLAGGIAHDINNLLMAIQGNVSLMMLKSGPEHLGYDRCRKIEALVKSGSELTGQLLGFARGGKYNVKTENINGIIRESLSMFGRTRKEISIRERYHGEHLTVEVDSNQIKQVLLNLFLNASHAMPEGGNLYIETDSVDLDESFVVPDNLSPGRYVKVSVRDTGLGMDEATLSQIFDPFFTTKGRGRGTGLGLASAYGIVKNHRGIITASSKIGVGTTFEIYFAFSDKEVESESSSIAHVEKGNETILIIDDEAAIREITREMVRELGYSYLIAESGREAIELYRKKHQRIDLVLLDMVMPDMGGDVVYNSLCSINPQVKVVLSSGYSMSGKAEKIISSGYSGFIQKPFSLHDLSDTIRNAITDEADCLKKTASGGMLF